MGARVVSPRILILAGVAALHGLVLLLLVIETRARLVARMSDATPLIVTLLEARELRQTPPATRRVPHVRSLRAIAPAAAPSEAAPPAPSSAAGITIDWAAEAAAAANAQLAADARRALQANALAPPQSALFAAPAKRREFHWDDASIHRTEAVPGLATIVHLNDQCAVALFLFIPFAAGCTLDKLPARGDLFDHMHDSQP